MSQPSPTLPSQVQLREVGRRDGLQNMAGILPTEPKPAWLRAAHAAGQCEIDVGSLVPARWLPQLATRLARERLHRSSCKAGLPRTMRQSVSQVATA